MEYKKYNEKFLNSINNHEFYIREKRENDFKTSKNLENLEKKLNDGYYRSLERKD